MHIPGHQMMQLIDLYKYKFATQNLGISHYDAKNGTFVHSQTTPMQFPD